MQKQEFLKKLSIKGQDYHILDINLLEKKGITNISRLPFSIRILVENLLRKLDNHIVREEDLLNIAKWQKVYDTPVEIPHHPARVLMQDFTGVPAVVDLAAMRDAVKTLGGDPQQINPLIPVELIIDHSIQLDYTGTSDSLDKNVIKEYERNSERYKLLKWAQKSFDNFKVVPPNSGICHQVNLEYLARVIITREVDGKLMAFPDSLVGTDSHTTMINSIGVMGWGVGGIEAEAVMLGQPYFMSIPEVIGVKMTGRLKPGVTATDMVLTVTQMLRQQKVVEKFVEFFGPGMKNLSIPDRATIANMSPEYGATMGFFPVDEKTVEYLNLTSRTEQAEIVEICTKELNLFYTGDNDPEYTNVLEFDLNTVVPSLAGPSRPQDRIVLDKIEDHFNGGKQRFTTHINKKEVSIGDGSIVIAAITSCTNTSNPFVLIGAGLMAKKAVEKGLKVPNHVKTSLAPGSRVVEKYLEDAGLMPYFETLGFHIAGFGCTTCIGNSGPLHLQIEQLIKDHDLTVVSILSGNRNFEARIHQSIKGNFLASPMLVIGFAIAGRININLTKTPLCIAPNGEPVYLKDIWPENKEIENLVKKHVKKEFYKNVYSEIFNGDKLWQNLKVSETTTYDWDKASTYIRNPPYFENFSLELKKKLNISGASPLLFMGDSVTTDHISPAGAIPEAYPAGKYLTSKDVKTKDFNSYGSRRGNHEVMMRGTFGNIRIKNQLLKNKEGSFTLKFPENEEMYIYDAAKKYSLEGIPLIVLGGSEYGTGSSRDWAAKGTTLLGIKAVIVESYERIHRSNLVGMGVLPLQFKEGENWENLGLDGSEIYSITGIENMKPRNELEVKAVKKDGNQISFKVISRLNTDIEVEYFEHGGILPYVLRKLFN